MRGIKTQLLGIGILLCGIVLSLNNFIGFVVGIFGLVAVIAGYFFKDYNI
ncbi:hypothetical protein [Oscillibacter sp.]